MAESSDPSAALAPAGYEILQMLGRGGMGVVYKARQIGLNRLVALKMILAGGHASAEELARFRTEAEAVARLQHPNIVQVHEVGTHEGRPFMVLELAEKNLVKALAGTPVPARQAAQWLETLARAVQYAHEHGIIHRDLKPANVLLNQDGTLKITDFGMAKIARPGPGHEEHTHTGAVLGSPSYMAPEQAAGQTHVIGPRTDVYGLGAILHELLTGRPPFRGRTLTETLDQVRQQELTSLVVTPDGPRFSVPRDLETICLTCLHKEPGQRYASAAALADDLRAFLAGEPIRSRRAGPLARLRRWAKRRPAEAALAAATAMTLVGLGVGLWWSNPLTSAAVGGLGLLAGVCWYNARLSRALREVTRQQAVAERWVERLQLLLEMTRRLIQAPDTDDLLRLLAETCARLVHAELATIYLIDPQSGELWSKVTLDEGVGEIRLPLGVGIAGTVAVTGEPINIPDVYADPRFNPAIDRRTGHKTRSLLTVAMKTADGRLLGVFQVINKQDGVFGLDDIEILSALAASAAIVIGRAGSLGDID
jgi:serine/threonine-protein kinase